MEEKKSTIVPWGEKIRMSATMATFTMFEDLKKVPGGTGARHRGKKLVPGRHKLGGIL